jgi:hypothetical protein
LAVVTEHAPPPTGQTCTGAPASAAPLAVTWPRMTPPVGGAPLRTVKR